MFTDFIKFMGYLIMTIVVLVVAILAAPTMWEQATSDKPEYPHSGFSPESPTWEAPENDLLLERNLRK